MTTAVCQHLHRVLSTPNGPTVEGKCKDCGHIRYFSSSLEGQYDPKLIKTFESQAQSVRRGQRGQQEARKARVNITLSQHKSEQETYVLPLTYVPVQPMGVRVAPDGSRRRAPSKPPLNAAQRQIVAFLNAHDGVTSADVAAHMGIASGNTSERLGKLARRGVIERRPGAVRGTFVYYGLKKTPLCASGDGNAVLIPQGEEVVRTSKG